MFQTSAMGRVAGWPGGRVAGWPGALCSEIPPKKIRCLNCGFISRCYLNPLKCKAKDKNCNSCQRKGHFPKSRNCLKTRQKNFKQKSNHLEQQQGCQTLRNFLKCCRYKLTNEMIPYDKLLQLHHSTLQKTTILGKSDKTISDDKIYEIIKHKILLLENKIELEEKVGEFCLIDKAFLQTYLLLNLDMFLIGGYQCPIVNYEDMDDSNIVIENYVDIAENKESETDDLESVLKSLN